MALTPQLRMDLRAAQSMVMTPQLSQAIALLQMTNLELNAYVEEQLAQNPFLEKSGGDTPPAGENTANPDLLTQQPNDVRAAYDAVPEDKSTNAEPIAHDGVYDEPQDASFHYDSDSYAGTGAGGRSDFEGDERGYDATLATTISLRDHLLDQVAMSFSDPRDQALGGWLVDFIDEGGYLRQNLDELAANLKVDAVRLDGVLATLKTFDPTGIFARDLSECLALQLKDSGDWDDAYEKLLAHLDLLAGHDLKKLCTVCDIDMQDLKERVAHIRTLNPKPASAFDHLIVQTALPDVLMTPIPKSQGGGWRVELNHDTLPKVLINNSYVAEVESAGGGRETKSYVSQQLANANWLIRAMDQRAQSVLAIASAIVEAQQGFFLYGIEFLKTMTLKDIAEEVGVHESTVSRIVNGKFMATPRGLFELKFFFSSGVTNTDGQDVAAEAVKAKIKTMIDAEDPKDILSDDTLAEMLQKDGINVARRTVAKYREAMGFGSSVQRRRQKNT